MESPEGLIVNPRARATELRTQRGRVFDRNGVEIAGRVVGPDGLTRRTYPVPTLSYLVGYYTANAPINRGNAGLEGVYDDYLSGREGDPVQAARSRLLRRPVVDPICPTVDADLQNLGQRLLGDQRGAVIVMNPRSGEVLAMVSNPAYNAADLAYNPEAEYDAELGRLTEAWDGINSDNEAARLVNRATQGRYSPGSVFKTVTAAAALDSNVAQPDTVYEDDGRPAVGGSSCSTPTARRNRTAGRCRRVSVLAERRVR
ncbi:MAG: penicillin-binding transpeptidase domain-containing protein [Chloroflexia bacterium]